MSDRRCIVGGCDNEVVRVLRRSDGKEGSFGLCAFHVRRAIMWLKPEQVANLVIVDQP